MPYSFLPLDVGRELKRIGVNRDLLPAIATSGKISLEEFVDWLRTIPGGIGHEAFLARLGASPERGGPHPPRPDETPAPDVELFVDRETDEMKVLLTELERVVPESTLPPGRSFGFTWPHGRSHALAVLRSLPDAAGAQAFFRALGQAPPQLADHSEPGA